VPAEAQRYGGGGYRGGGYHGGYRGHGNGAGLAVGAGILGLAVGAAIASNNRGGDRYYDRGYRGGGYYEGPVYRDSYYYDGPRYRDYRSCWTERVWDEYRGGWARLQRCR
jgi:hypothetical protein